VTQDAASISHSQQHPIAKAELPATFSRFTAQAVDFKCSI
jgi:hypothetical protein